MPRDNSDDNFIIVHVIHTWEAYTKIFASHKYRMKVWMEGMGEKEMIKNKNFKTSRLSDEHGNGSINTAKEKEEIEGKG